VARSRRARVPLVTLTSDVGAAYAAQMKAVLARALPPGHVVDLSHDLAPHAVAEAGFLLRAMAAGFPAGTVHVAVVDPGVGGRRLPIVVRCADGSLLVGPDNGVLEPLARALGAPRAFRLRPERIGSAPRVGATFDGRDLFAPAAARLALGADPARLGERVALRALPLDAPRRRGGTLYGTVVHVDRFGNLITSLPTAWLPPSASRARVAIGRGRARILPVVTHYAALRAGSAGVLGSSFGLLEVAVAGDRAVDRWRAASGSPVVVRALAPARRSPHTVNSAGTRSG
jgi:S-adenosyl-L-methionine hydrolase (adenosine-forming)